MTADKTGVKGDAGIEHTTTTTSGGTTSTTTESAHVTGRSVAAE